VEAAREEYRKINSDRTKSPGQKQVALEQKDAAERTYRESVPQAVENNKRAVAAIRKELAAVNADFVTAKAADVDASTLALLNSGVLNINDLASLAKQFASNPTMLRLIGAQAEKVEGPNNLSVAIEQFCSPETRMNTFDVFARQATYSDPLFAEVYNAYWAEKDCDRATARMQALESFEL
jgi:hypothetical protein